MDQEDVQKAKASLEDIMLEQLQNKAPRQLSEEEEAFQRRGEELARRQGEMPAPRRKAREVDRFLQMMSERGNGNVTLAWRRHFDRDGDGELDFTDFCNVLAGLNYKGDVIRLWHDISPQDGNFVQLEVLDPEGAGILVFFGNWCEKVLDGPTEVFRAMDTDGSNSLTGDEFAEGLRVLGFFQEAEVPANLATEHLVLANLFPLLDVNGFGHVMAEHLLFLERKKEKKAKLKREFGRIHKYGKVNAIEPLPRQADELLRKRGKRSVKSFGDAQQSPSNTATMAIMETPSAARRLSPAAASPAAVVSHRRRVLRRTLSTPVARSGQPPQVTPASLVQLRPTLPGKWLSAEETPEAKAAAKPRAVSGEQQKARLRKKVYCQSLVPACPALDQLLGQDPHLLHPAPLPQRRCRTASTISCEPHRHWDFMTAAKDRGIWEFYDSRPVIPDPL